MGGGLESTIPNRWCLKENTSQMINSPFLPLAPVLGGSVRREKWDGMLKRRGEKNLNQYVFHYSFDSWLFSDYFSIFSWIDEQRKIACLFFFLGLFLFKPNYQPANMNEDYDQKCVCVCVDTCLLHHGDHNADFGCLGDSRCELSSD